MQLSFIPDELIQFEILPYIDKTLYGQLLQVDKNINNLIKTGATSIIIKITALTDQDLIKWKKNNILLELDHHKNSQITEQGLLNVSGLKMLALHKNSQITGLLNVPGLKILSLYHNSKITDQDLLNVSGLKMLVLWNYSKITDQGLLNVPGLQILHLFDNSKITDQGLLNVPGLQILILNQNSKITDQFKAKFKEKGGKILSSFSYWVKQLHKIERKYICNTAGFIYTLYAT
jgi:hypothetical protein